MTTKAQHGWRPIETVPRNGTVVLLRHAPEVLALYASAAPKKTVAIGYFDQWWVVGTPGGSSEGGGDNQYTHWMPLPEPPQ